jgi:hypothetical protein
MSFAVIFLIFISSEPFNFGYVGWTACLIGIFILHPKMSSLNGIFKTNCWCSNSIQSSWSSDKFKWSFSDNNEYKRRKSSVGGDNKKPILFLSIHLLGFQISVLSFSFMLSIFSISHVSVYYVFLSLVLFCIFCILLHWIAYGSRMW